MRDVQHFDFSLIRPALKSVFQQAGINVALVCQQFTEDEQRLMPFDEVQRWFYATDKHPMPTNFIPPILAALFLGATVRAIEALDGQVTDLDRQRIARATAPSAVSRRFRHPR
jgi:hypothetical protein